MKTEIKQTIDGEWQTPPRRNFYRSCCDCGLVHREEYRVRDGRVQYRVWREPRETKLERNRVARELERRAVRMEDERDRFRAALIVIDSVVPSSIPGNSDGYVKQICRKYLNGPTGKD